MYKKYSRLSRTEDKKNFRHAIVYVCLTVFSLTLFIVFGIPTVAKFASFLTELKKSNEPVDKNDTTPPIVPRIAPLSEAVNQDNIEIKGSTEPGATVILFLNNKKEEVLANKEGNFSYIFSLNAGVNTISALAKDASGNESQKTDIVKVIHDNIPPELIITKPEDGSKYYGSKQRQIVIEGTTDENSGVEINGRLVFVENDGTFAFATTLSEGQNDFKIRSEDKAGNSTEASLTLHFTP